jgi:hypothetical protein
MLASWYVQLDILLHLSVNKLIQYAGMELMGEPQIHSGFFYSLSF